MKAIFTLLTCLLLFSSANTFAQSFSFVKESKVSAWGAETKKLIAARMPVKNDLADASDLNWRIIKNTIVDVKGWKMTLCDPCNCFTDIPFKGVCPFYGSETKDFIVDVEPNNTKGEGELVIKIWGANETEAQGKEFNVYIKVVPTSTEELLSSAQVEIAPNPANNFIQVNIPTSGISLKEVAIIDLTGKVVSQNSVLENQIDVSALSQGLYFLRLTDTEGHSLLQKFVKN